MPDIFWFHNAQWTLLGEGGIVPPAEPDTTPPLLPTNFRVTAVTTSSITLAWNASSDPVISGQLTSGIGGYEIQTGTTAQPWVPVGNVLSSPRTGLATNTVYTFRVRAFDVGGNRSPAATLTQSTSAVGPPVVRLLFGIHDQNPDDSLAVFDAYNDLDVFRDGDPVSSVDTFDDHFKSLVTMGSGPLFSIGSKYNGQGNAGGIYTLDAYAQKILAKYECLHIIVGCKPYLNMVNNYATHKAAIKTGLVDRLLAYPAGTKRIIAGWINEPARNEDDAVPWTTATPGSAASRDEYSQSFAYFARACKELSTQYGVNLVAATCYTANSLVDQGNGTTVMPDAAQWNPRVRLEAQGLTVNDVVMMQHGYCNPDASRSSFPTSSFRFNAVFNLLRSWGFTRLGMGEGSTKSRTLANYNRMDEFLNDLESFIESQQLQFDDIEAWIYYMSGGPSTETNSIASQDGWWIVGQWTGAVPNGGNPSLSGDPSHTTTNQHRVRFAEIAKRFNGRT